MKNAIQRFSVVAAVAAALCCGCQKQKLPDGMPELFPCVVKIEQDGKALVGATVTLVPKDGAADRGSSGITDSFGNAKIKTQGKYDGAPRGKYDVVVQKIEIEGYDELQKAVINGESFPKSELPIYSFVDEKFGSAETSGLEIEVDDKTKATFDAGPAVRVQTDVYECGESDPGDA